MIRSAEGNTVHDLLNIEQNVVTRFRDISASIRGRSHSGTSCLTTSLSLRVLAWRSTSISQGTDSWTVERMGERRGRLAAQAFELFRLDTPQLR